MRIDKLHASDVRNVLKEHNRTGKSKDGDIDTNKTEKNYNLAPRDLDTLEDMKDYIAVLFDKYGITRKVRGDATLVVDAIITKPQDCSLSDDDFAKLAYSFCINHFCGSDESLVVQSYLHLDETTPHLNFNYVPIIKSKDKYRLSAKDQLTKSFMYDLHPSLQAYMDEHGKGKAGTYYTPEKAQDKKTRHLTTTEYKAYKEALKENEKLKKEVKKLNENRGKHILQNGKIEAENKIKQNKINELNGEIQEKTITRDLIENDISLLTKDKEEIIKEIENSDDIVKEIRRQYYKKLKEAKKIYDNQKEMVQKKIDLTLIEIFGTNDLDDIKQKLEELKEFNLEYDE